jgi:hypothetical protein
MPNGSRADGARSLGHGPSNLSHAREAHFGEEIEVILVDDNDFWLLRGKNRQEVYRRLLKHWVKCRDGDASFSKRSGSIESGERYIWLHLAQLFWIVREMVGMCN